MFLGKASGTITSGAVPNSVSPSWLTLNGVSVWGMNSNVSFIAPAFYQTYNGFAAFSHREHIKQLF
jgi:hypothetical protein